MDRERQLRLYGHEARLLAEDPAHRIVLLPRSELLDHAKGRPKASWLSQVEIYVREMGMTGLAFARAIARRRPKEYRPEVDAATRCSGVCPHTLPDLT